MSMPVISKDVWITREGQQIEINKMASSHLLATIHFIENRRFMNAAEVYSERQLGEGRLAAVNYYLTWPIQYETMILEAQRRHLIYRGEDAEVRSDGVKKLERKK